MGSVHDVQLGPGVYVGPVFVIVGLLLIARRASAGKLVAWISPRSELATPLGAIICGATSIVMGTFATLVGLHVFR